MDNSFLNTLPTAQQQMFAFPSNGQVVYGTASQQVLAQRPAPSVAMAQCQELRQVQAHPSQLQSQHLQQQPINLPPNISNYDLGRPVMNTNNIKQQRHSISNGDLSYNGISDQSLLNQQSWPVQQSTNDYFSSVKVQPAYNPNQQGSCISPLDTPVSNLFSSWDPSVQIPPTIKEEWPVTNNNIDNPTFQQDTQFPIPFFPNDSQQQYMFLPASSRSEATFDFQTNDTTLDFTITPSTSTTTTSTPVTFNNNADNYLHTHTSTSSAGQQSTLNCNSDFPPLSLTNAAGRNMGYNKVSSCNNDLHAHLHLHPQQQQLSRHSTSREVTPPPSITASGSNSPNSSISTPPPLNYFLTSQHHQQQQQQQQPNNANMNVAGTMTTGPTVVTATTATSTATPSGKGRRGSSNNRRKSDSNAANHKSYRRRASSHPSVASVVSLSAHEPVSRIIDGIEYITFLYSHDRLIKEYTVRTDVHNVNLDAIPDSFRVQNAIYPRANVPREEYDGNRWDYETRCNRLGWEICWLNQEQLCGRRGLIQRAVDSYRNRHAELRSRRVTRQEKVNNGTLRKRSRKKSFIAL